MCMPLYTKAKLPLPISPRRCHRFAIVTVGPAEEDEVEPLDAPGTGLAAMLNVAAETLVLRIDCWKGCVRRLPLRGKP